LHQITDCCCALHQMSDASSSSHAPARLSRADVLKRKEAAAAAEKEIREAQAKLEALNMGALASTLERSLENNLRAEHDRDALVAVQEMYNDIKPEDLMYDDADVEDGEDVAFWDHGVSEPEEKISAEKPTVKDVTVLLKQWVVAYRALEIKFLRRAIYAHDLRRVYEKKRQQLKVALAKADQSTQAAVMSEQKAVSAVAYVTKVKAISTKACGCKTTNCESASCGCKKGGLGCSIKCACSGAGNCCNPYSYPDTPEGEKKHEEAEDAERARAKEVLKAKKKAKLEADIAARMEGGQL
jgi:hypothetical protein